MFFFLDMCRMYTPLVTEIPSVKSVIQPKTCNTDKKQQQNTARISNSTGHPMALNEAE